jgi:lauroyl/myristoyl acyltransferase
MNLISLATSRCGPALVMILCRVLPRRVLCHIARHISSRLACQRQLAFVQAIRANSAIVHGLSPGQPELDEIAVELLYNALVSYVDFFRLVQVGPAEARVLCCLDPAMVRTVEDCLASGRGLVLVGAHMCSFDIMLLGLKELFPSVQILSNANPEGSSQVMNRIRAEQGLYVTPISVGALREAVTRLRGGGVVAIAVDIPHAKGEALRFFGHEATLPVGHARLALATGARILVGASHRVDKGTYRAEVTLTPRPESTGDPRQDMVRWAEDALVAVEGFIRRWPEEWLMPEPVWT